MNRLQENRKSRSQIRQKRPKQGALPRLKISSVKLLMEKTRKAQVKIQKSKTKRQQSARKGEEGF